MERLRRLLFLSTACLFAQCSLYAGSPAQLSSSAPSTPAAQSGTMPAEFTVAGDVVQPANYVIPPNQPISLQQAILSAGPAAETVVVMIIRPGQAETQWTQFVSRSSGEAGPTVAAGDILVVQAHSRVDQQVAPNAVFFAGQRTIVHSLQASEDRKICIGDVLTVNQLPVEMASQLRRLSTRPGRTRTKALTPFETVEHGDVLRLADSVSDSANRSRVTSAANRGFHPMVSELSGTVSQVSAVQVSGTIDSAFTLPQPQVPQPQVPETPELPSGIAADYGDPAESNTSAEDDELLSQSSIPDLTVSESASRSDDATVPAESASSSEEVDELDSFGAFGPVPADFEDSAPLPPEESPVAEQTSAMSIWNLAFVAGLLIAGGLIIAGWIKSEAELKQLERAQIVNDEIITDAETSSAAAAAAVAVTEEKQTGRHQEPALEAVAPAVTIMTPVAPLVASHEWRAKDWRVIVDELQSTLPKPSFSAAILPEQVIAADQVLVTEPVLVTNQVAITERFADAPGTAPSPGISSDVMTEKTEVTGKPVEAEEVSTVPGPVFGELNDLIENRLPVDLCEAQLPLRIALFGNAAGPRRLRVDGAHTQLAGPHMAMAAERRRTETVAATSAQPVNEPTDPLPRTEETPAPKRQRGSLDRALNQLHEQGE